MKLANVSRKVDTGYKNGKVVCKCGWTREFGNGFNQYYIDNCPACTPELQTRLQDTGMTGRPGDYTVKHGSFTYFVLSNGIYVQYRARVIRTEHRRRL